MGIVETNVIRLLTLLTFGVVQNSLCTNQEVASDAGVLRESLT